jgi:hypothetical protein
MKLAMMISTFLIVGNSWALFFERVSLKSSKKVSLRGQALSSFKCPLNVVGNIVPGCSIFSLCLYDHPLRLINSEGNAVSSCPSALSSCTGTEIVLPDTTAYAVQVSPTSFGVVFGDWLLMCFDPNDTYPTWSGSGVIGDLSYENGGYFVAYDEFSVPYYSAYCQSLLHLIEEGILIT